jgi:hypothetical protein
MDRLLPRLLCRSPLMPGESLASLLIRLSVENFYSSLTTVERLCRERLTQPDNVTRPTRPETYQVLADLVEIEPDDLYGASVYRFATTLTPPNYELQFTTLPSGRQVPVLNNFRLRKNVRPNFEAQFCPSCLREAAYHRLAWVPLAVAACLKHRCLLLNRCPQCQSRVSVLAIVDTHCCHCGYNLAIAESPSLSGDEWGLFTQQLIMAWLGLAPAPTSAWVDTLPQHSLAVLYRVAEGLRASAARAGLKWHHMHSVAGVPSPPYDAGDKKSIRKAHLQAATSYLWHATAIKGLVRWPEGFYDFLRAYRNRPGVQAENKLSRDLGIVYSYWISIYWEHPPFQFVQDAFDAYLLEEYALSPSFFRSTRYQSNPALAERSKYIHQTQAKQLLGTTLPSLRYLVDAGSLVCFRAEEQPDGRIRTPSVFFEREEILAMQREWQNRLSVLEASALLGVHREMVLTMVEEGLLTAERGPRLGSKLAWLFNRDMINDFLDRLEAGTELVQASSASKLITLLEATKVLVYYAFDGAKLLKWILDGKLHAYRRAGAPLRAGDLLFAKSDIRRVAEEFKLEKGWVERKEIVKRMRVRLAVVLRWIESGLLSPCAMVRNKMYFDRQTVEEFIVGHVFCQEAAEILGLTPFAVRNWAKRGRLKPVAGPLVDGCHCYLFRREEVERLRPENRVNVSQMAKRLGISSSYFYYLIRIGKVKPVSGPGIDGCKQYLFVLDDWDRVVSLTSRRNARLG